VRFNGTRLSSRLRQTTLRSIALTLRHVLDHPRSLCRPLTTVHSALDRFIVSPVTPAADVLYSVCPTASIQTTLYRKPRETGEQLPIFSVPRDKQVNSLQQWMVFYFKLLPSVIKQYDKTTELKTTAAVKRLIMPTLRPKID